MTLIFLFIALVIFEKVFIRLYEKSWNKGLGIKVGFLEGAVDEGKKGHIIEEIYNKSALPIPVVSVKFELDKSISTWIRAMLPCLTGSTETIPCQ